MVIFKKNCEKREKKSKTSKKNVLKITINNAALT